MGLDLYAKIESFLDFEEEIYTLHKEFLKFIIVNDLDNIIDIGCGQGYFLENLKINKKKAFGIDLSLEQIKVCKEKSLNAKLISLCEVKEKFNCATAIFDVLNYIPRKELKTFIKEVSEILNPNGYFIFDINTYFGFDEIAQGSIIIDKEYNFITIDANFEDNKLQTDITLFSKEKDGKFVKEQDSILQEYHSCDDIKKLMSKYFEIIEIRDLFLYKTEKPDKLIFICKKLK